MKQLSIILLLFSPVLFAQTYEHYFDYKTIDTNNISANFSNYGGLYNGANWLLLTPYEWIVYDASPWIVGKFNGAPAAALNEWFYLYSPGPIINGQAGIIAQPEDSLTFRIYKISKGDDNSNPDYAQWPDTLGAPINQNGDPLIYGDQTLWTVYNGVDSTLNARNWYEDYFPPLPVEIRQTVFAHTGNYNDAYDVFSNVIFMEWIIINKGELPIDSAYFGFWSDIDFDINFRNYPAVDSTYQVAYCWGDTTGILEPDPAVGFQLLYGPVIVSAGDTAIFKGRRLPGYKNLPMTSFHGIGDDADFDPLTGSIRSLNDTWNAARGFDLNGNVIINPVTNAPTRFPFNGDPVTQQGWYQFPTSWVGGGAGVLFFSGPFNLAPQDTQWAMVALVPGLSGTNLESIVDMREKAAILSSLPYDTLSGIPVFKDDGNGNIPNKFTLYQNYPNPFNSGTTIKISTLKKVQVNLIVYDILGAKVKELKNEVMDPGFYEIRFNAANLSSGVYFYQLKAGDFIQTKKMVLLK